MSIAKNCRIKDCNRVGTSSRGKRVFIRGYCGRHYRSLRNYNDLFKIDREEEKRRIKTETILLGGSKNKYYETYLGLGLTASQYVSVHCWIKRRQGKASRCDVDSSHQGAYEWANISRTYLRDERDWRQLCRSCHSKEGWTDSNRVAVSQRSSKPVEQYKDDLLLKRYPSIVKASEENKISRTSIHNCLSGLSKTGGGYQWKRAHQKNASRLC